MVRGRRARGGLKPSLSGLENENFTGLLDDLGQQGNLRKNNLLKSIQGLEMSMSHS